jgi:hypothetical protein
MIWSWPEMSAWSYALTTAGMILFWILVIFGAIVLVHYLGRDNASPVGGSVVDDSSPIVLQAVESTNSSTDSAPSGSPQDVPEVPLRPTTLVLVTEP